MYILYSIIFMTIKAVMTFLYVNKIYHIIYNITNCDVFGNMVKRNSEKAHTKRNKDKKYGRQKFLK